MTDIILYLDVTAFIAGSRDNLVGFNPVTNRTQQQTELIHDPFVRWEHLDFDKTKSPTEVRGMNHHENEAGCG